MGAYWTIPLICLALTSCVAGPTAAKENNLPAGSLDPETSLPVVADLAPYGGSEPPGVEFSSDGQYVLCWWLPRPPIGDYHRILGRCVVFDLQANVVGAATNLAGQLAPEFVMKFKTTAVRQHFADFLKGTNNVDTLVWGFSQDYAMGFRTLGEREHHFAKGIAELWRFAPRWDRIWACPTPETGDYTGIAVFLGSAPDDTLLLAYRASNKAYVLSLRDGRVADSFTYGKPETEADELAYKRKFHLAGEMGDPSLGFYAGPLSFDAARRLLACGASYGRRIRVVNVDKPHNVIFEARTNDNPERPLGGSWSVDSVHFDAGGRYLVTESNFGGRLTRKYLNPVEIYDTASWRVVWSCEAKGIPRGSPPRISPDGKTIALARGARLEIGPFVPKPAGKSATGAK